VDSPDVYDLSIDEIDQFLCSLQEMDTTTEEYLIGKLLAISSTL
jgi:hypothetical protein